MRKGSRAAMGSRAGGGVRKFATHRGGMAVAALFGCFACGAAAQAQEEPHVNTFEITPFFGLMAGGSFEDPSDGSDRDVDSDTSFGVFLNLTADVHERQYELLYAQQSTVIQGGVPLDLDLQYLQIGGTVSYPQSPHVEPYFGVTVGAASFSPDAAGLDDETKFALSVGGGVKFPITDHIGIRLDIRSFVTFLQDDSEIFCVSVPATASCLIKPKSDTFVQYTGSLGFSVGF
jgi:opacity protein-like surface antigen